MKATRVEEIACWAGSLTAPQVPDAVFALCRAQRRSVLAAIASSLGDAAAKRVVGAIAASAPPGPAPLLGSRRRSRVEEALRAASALSIALDFDDYLCFGHTGHSAVLVPMLLAAETGATGQEQLTAQAAANEVEARLGAACLLGPLNGQMWSFVHAAGAAVAAGRLLGLDERQLAHALGIALYQAPRPTFPGFLAPDTKLLTAADPTLTGLRAARLAQGGVSGPLDVLDHPAGFLSAFAFEPLTALLSGWGRGWATQTLCVKPYPGCAYLDTTVDALLSLGSVDVDAVEAVDVEAGILTCGMDAVSREYASRGPSPVTVTFSLAWNAAVVLSAGELGPDQLSEEALAKQADHLAALARRVKLHHSWELTERTLRSVAPILSPRAVLLPLGIGRVARALAQVRRQHPGVALRARDALSFLRYAATSGRGADFKPWDPEALSAFRMTFPSRVHVRLKGGRTLSAEVDVPRGGAGHPSVPPTAAAVDKWRAYASRAYGAEQASRINDAVDSDQDDLWSLLSPEGPCPGSTPATPS